MSDFRVLSAAEQIKMQEEARACASLIKILTDSVNRLTLENEGLKSQLFDALKHNSK